MPERKILVEDVNGKFTVVIPDGCKVTFGPTVPYPARNPLSSGDRAYSLRIYQGNKENLLAVFPDVKGFRDLGLQIDIYDDPEEPADTEDSEREETPRRRRRSNRRRVNMERPAAPPVELPQADPFSLGDLAVTFQTTGTTATTAATQTGTGLRFYADAHAGGGEPTTR